MFEPAASWSLPAHLFMVSAWSAYCETRGDPRSCRNADEAPALPPDWVPYDRHGLPALVRRPDYAWTDLTYLLHRHHVSWAYYVANGTEPDCADDAMFCPARPQLVGPPGIWNPLPFFDKILGNLARDFDFSHKLRPPLLLPAWPKTDLIEPYVAVASRR